MLLRPPTDSGRSLIRHDRAPLQLLFLNQYASVHFPSAVARPAPQDGVDLGPLGSSSEQPSNVQAAAGGARRGHELALPRRPVSSSVVLECRDVVDIGKAGPHLKHPSRNHAAVVAAGPTKARAGLHDHIGGNRSSRGRHREMTRGAVKGAECPSIPRQVPIPSTRTDRSGRLVR